MESFDSLRRQLLAKVAELGGRYGLNPYDYELDVRPVEGPKGPMALAVTFGPPASQTNLRRTRRHTQPVTAGRNLPPTRKAGRTTRTGRAKGPARRSPTGSRHAGNGPFSGRCSNDPGHDDTDFRVTGIADTRTHHMRTRDGRWYPRGMCDGTNWNQRPNGGRLRPGRPRTANHPSLTDYAHRHVRHAPPVRARRAGRESVAVPDRPGLWASKRTRSRSSITRPQAMGRCAAAGTDKASPD